MLSPCWIAGSPRFSVEHVLKNSLGVFWVFQDQQKKQHCFIFGALWCWQMPSHFIMLQSRWQKSVAACRNSPCKPTKNGVLKGKVWHTESSKHKKAKPLPNHFCLLWACQSRTDFLNRKGYIMLKGNELQGTGKGNTSGDLWHHWKQALYCQIRSKTLPKDATFVFSSVREEGEFLLQDI